MKKVVKKKWVKALRSGDYDQGKHFLRHGGRYCCLGVLCDVQSKKALSGLKSLGTSQLPPRWAAGLTKEQMSELAKLNDTGKSFDKIADHIELWA